MDISYFVLFFIKNTKMVDWKIFNRNVLLSKGSSLYANDVKIIDWNGALVLPAPTSLGYSVYSWSLTQWANYGYITMWNAGTSLSITMTDDMNLFQQNISLTPWWTSKEFKLSRRQITTAGTDTDSYVKIAYDRLDIDHSIRTSYIWQGRYDWGTWWDSAEACYWGSLSITMNNTSALWWEMYGWYVAFNWDWSAGSIRDTCYQWAAIMPNKSLYTIYGAWASAFCSATNGMVFDGEWIITNAFNISMGSWSWITNLFNFNNATNSSVHSGDKTWNAKSYYITCSINWTPYCLQLYANA